MRGLRYCPRCAGRLVWRTFQRDRHPHPRCERCGYVLWQNPKPCVGAVIARRHAQSEHMVLRPLVELSADLREKMPELRGMLAGPMRAPVESLGPHSGHVPRELVHRLRKRRAGQVEALLVRRAVEPRRGSWDLPGGFVDPFEHPEDAIHREVKEELGVEVELQALLGLFVDSYADGDATLTVYYAATITSGAPAPADDVDAAQWFPLDALPRDLAFENVGDALAAAKELIEEGELAL